ncbi:hypothetical protein OIK40_14465 [Erythrobacter sp. sf7]|uniref:Uncharacterized protein n=1 Tax=Erythrobacter fulvus TaxID=2987523 RepID=A0ABT5JTF5_9SPHN|nr:hypothetical protein [Erythrobacter fulvus]MDC8755849.1 hypothetical protein [Erythrobacter fulvus]
MKTFSAAQVARSIGMSPSAFAMKFARDDWRLFSNDRPENGHAHSFTLGQAMVYALARELAGCGFSSHDAFMIALFGLEQSSADAMTTGVGEIFNEARGRTYFAAYHEGTIGEFFFEDGKLSHLFSPFNDGSEKRRVTVIDLTAIRDRMIASLEGQSA